HSGGWARRPRPAGGCATWPPRPGTSAGRWTARARPYPPGTRPPAGRESRAPGTRPDGALPVVPSLASELEIQVRRRPRPVEHKETQPEHDGDGAHPSRESRAPGTRPDGALPVVPSLDSALEIHVPRTPARGEQKRTQPEPPGTRPPAGRESRAPGTRPDGALPVVPSLASELEIQVRRRPRPVEHKETQPEHDGDGAHPSRRPPVVHLEGVGPKVREAGGHGQHADQNGPADDGRSGVPGEHLR